MTVNYTTNLALGQPVTGTESGTWGDDVNNAVTSYLDIAIAGGLAITVTTADVTLTLTQGTSAATNIGSTTAQYAILNVSGAMTAARNLIVPSSSRIYLINNNTTGGFALTVKGSATTGVTLVNGEKAHVFWNGSDYAKVSNSQGGAGSFTTLSATGNVTLGDASADTVTVNGTTTFNASPVISVTDNTNAALRITQLGTGNALLVEDISNPDASPFLINNGGVVVKGATVAYDSSSGSTPVVQVHGATTNSFNVGYATSNWATNTGGGSFTFAKSRGGTIGTHAIASANDILGIVSFMGSDGTAFIPSAQITGTIDGTPGQNAGTFTIGLSYKILTIGTTDFTLIGAASNTVGLTFTATGVGAGTGTAILTTGDMPGRLTFSTTADGASSVTERMRIDSTGDVGIGTTSPEVKLEIAGNNNTLWIVTASITGTTMDVTIVTTGTIAVGDLVYGANVQPYTKVTAQLTGTTGGIGTYTVSVSQTVTSSAATYGTTQYGSTLIRITDTDVNQQAGQPTGALQFFTSDASSPTAGVGAYVAALAEDSAPDTALVFGTRAETGGGVDANERMRIDSSGNLGIGTTSPQSLLDLTGNDPTLRFTDNAGSPASTFSIRSTDGTLKFRDVTNSSDRLAIDASGNVLVVAAAGLGYGTGSGGTVTQATDKSTAVTLNKPTGQITMNAAALLANTNVSFTLNNSLLSATDTLLVHRGSAGSAGVYFCTADGVGAGSCSITVRNTSASSLSEAIVLNFTIIKGATS